MTLERRIARLFGLDDDAWMRHANPWSVWSRASVLPLLVGAVWSRVWLGWWALLPVGMTAVWTWLNPHLFAAPASTDNWASKAVLGERVWSRRDEVAVPEGHRFVPHLLNGLNGLASLVLIWGLWRLHLWGTICGMIGMYLAKFWYLDRMVWLYEEMKETRAEYREWLY